MGDALGVVRGSEAFAVDDFGRERDEVAAAVWDPVGAEYSSDAR
jgi:hypothetical protein